MLCCGIRLACRTARVAARTGLRLLTLGLLLRLSRPWASRRGADRRHSLRGDPL